MHEEEKYLAFYYNDFHQAQGIFLMCRTEEHRA